MSASTVVAAAMMAATPVAAAAAAGTAVAVTDVATVVAVVAVLVAGTLLVSLLLFHQAGPNLLPVHPGTKAQSPLKFLPKQVTAIGASWSILIT